MVEEHCRQLWVIEKYLVVVVVVVVVLVVAVVLVARSQWMWLLLIAVAGHSFFPPPLFRCFSISGVKKVQRCLEMCVCAVLCLLCLCERNVSATWHCSI